MPYHRYRTQVIFLKKSDRGEADQFLTIFTEKFGKIEVAAKSIRKITSKLRSGADVFYFSEIEFIEGKNQKKLTDAILIDSFKNIRANCEKLSLAYGIAEVLDSLIVKEEKDARIWKLLTEIFKKLDNPKLLSAASQIFYFYFLWNFFSILGYLPELYNCAACGKKLLPETFFFAPQEGGVICWQCFDKLKREKDREKKLNAKSQQKWGQEITVETVKVLRFFLKDSIGFLERLIISGKDKNNLIAISDFYLSFLKEI